ncbi:hypothetical protein A4S06_09890 [Erysipelotrichaceae bacterium MTC7]|nr:hypothetical protein A4S06_09890 [Erysipelotrichaceae bacterium MTC7]
MSLLQAILLALWAGFCSFDDQGPQMFRRPLLIGPIAGLILGDLQSALIMSATLELMWMGLGNMAGYVTPDMIIGTIVGVVVTVQTGEGTSDASIAAGVAAATTVAVLVQQLMVIFNNLVKQLFAPWADRLALSGNFDSIMKINIVASLAQFAIRAVPTFLVVYFSTSIVDSALNAIPTNVLNGLSVASGILPAVGLSILMTMMMKGIFWPFLISGFVLATYMGQSVLSVTLFSLFIAIIYDMIMEIKAKQDEMPKVSTVAGVVEEEEYDL